MKILYTTSATAAGGRSGTVRSDDGALELALALPPGLGGLAGRAGTNPEQLFAAGYSACFQSSLEVAARRRGFKAASSVVTAEVQIGRCEDNSLALQVTLDIGIAGVDDDTARTLVEDADALCPYSNAVRGNIEVTKSVVVTAGTDQ